MRELKRRFMNQAKSRELAEKALTPVSSYEEAKGSLVALSFLPHLFENGAKIRNGRAVAGCEVQITT